MGNIAYVVESKNKDDIMSLRHLVQDTQEQTKRASVSSRT